MSVRPASAGESDPQAFVIELDNGEQLGPIGWNGEYTIETRPWVVEQD